MLLVLVAISQKFFAKKSMGYAKVIHEKKKEKRDKKKWTSVQGI
jgi:hypothetical protein